MKLAGGVSLAVVTFLATFYFTVWVGSPLLLLYYPPEWVILAVPSVFAVVTSLFVWRQSASTRGTFERGRRLGTGVWAWYLTTGAVLAVTRVSLFVWLSHQRIKHIYTETNAFMEQWLYPEVFVDLLWRSLVAYADTKYYLAWCSLIAIGSFVMAMPILFVAGLSQKRPKVDP